MEYPTLSYQSFMKGEKMEKSKRLLREVLWSVGEFILLYFVFVENSVAAKNILLFYVFVIFLFSGVVFFAVLVPDYQLVKKIGFEKIEKKMRSKVIPLWFWNICDLLFVGILVAYGFWWTGLGYLFSVFTKNMLEEASETWYKKELRSRSPLEGVKIGGDLN